MPPVLDARDHQRGVGGQRPRGPRRYTTLWQHMLAALRGPPSTRASSRSTRSRRTCRRPRGGGAASSFAVARELLGARGGVARRGAAWACCSSRRGRARAHVRVVRGRAPRGRRARRRARWRVGRARRGRRPPRAPCRPASTAVMVPAETGAAARSGALPSRARAVRASAAVRESAPPPSALLVAQLLPRRHARDAPHARDGRRLALSRAPDDAAMNVPSRRSWSRATSRSAASSIRRAPLAARAPVAGPLGRAAAALTTPPTSSRPGCKRSSRARASATAGELGGAPRGFVVRYRGFVDATRAIAAEHGARGFFRGGRAARAHHRAVVRARGARTKARPASCSPSPQAPWPVLFSSRA